MIRIWKITYKVFYLGEFKKKGTVTIVADTDNYLKLFDEWESYFYSSEGFRVELVSAYMKGFAENFIGKAY